MSCSRSVSCAILRKRAYLRIRAISLLLFAGVDGFQCRFQPKSYYRQLISGLRSLGRKEALGFRCPARLDLHAQYVVGGLRANPAEAGTDLSSAIEGRLHVWQNVLAANLAYKVGPCHQFRRLMIAVMLRRRKMTIAGKPPRSRADSSPPESIIP